MNLREVYIYMNRYNFGNVTTNAMQIGSTAAFTGSRSLGNAASALNNLSLSEKRQYGEMQANMIRNQMADYDRISDDERELIGEAKARKAVDSAKAYLDKEDKVDVDEIMGALLPDTEQGDDLLEFVKNNFDWVQKRNKGKFTNEFTPVWKTKEVDDNADV